MSQKKEREREEGKEGEREGCTERRRVGEEGKECKM